LQKVFFFGGGATFLTHTVHKAFARPNDITI